MNAKTETTVQRVTLTKDEAAAYLGVAPVTLYRLTKAGKVAHVRLGRLMRWRREDLDAFLASAATTRWENFKEEDEG